MSREDDKRALENQIEGWEEEEREAFWSGSASWLKVVRDTIESLKEELKKYL